MSLLKEAWNAVCSVVKQVVQAVWKHYIGIIAGLVILGMTNLTSFVIGKNVAVEIVDNQNRFGAHCFGPTVRANLEGTPGFEISSSSITNSMVCGRGTYAKDTPEATLVRYVGRYDKCFAYDTELKKLSFYKGEDSLLETFKNGDGKIAAACNCVEGQARMIAEHSAGPKKWCGIDPPDPKSM